MTEILPRPMTLDEFLPLIGKEMTVDSSPASVGIRLIEAKPLPDRGGTERPPFILIFRSAADTMLIDGLYTMRCEQFGPAAVAIGSMLSPTGAEPGHYYQAVFN